MRVGVIAPPWVAVPPPAHGASHEWSGGVRPDDEHPGTGHHGARRRDQALHGPQWILHAGPTPLEVRWRRCGTMLDVEVSGVLCVRTTTLVRQRLLDLVDTSDVAGVTLDLAGVTFIDGRGVSLLLALRRQAVMRGASLHLAGLSPPVARLIAICGLESALHSPSRPGPTGRCAP